MPDRTPPHSLPTEEALLGAMLLSVDAITAAVTAVEASDFYRPTHARIFDTVCDLYSSNRPCDPITVAEALDASALDGIGGLDGLLGLQMNTPATSNAASYAALVASHATRRRVIAAGAEIVAAGYDAVDGDDACAKAAALLAAATRQAASADLVPLGDAVQAVLDRWADIEDGKATAGQPTGIGPLDAHLGGLRDGSLCVVGARTGAGKTSFGLAAAYHIARTGNRPVLISSLEMSAAELAQRQLLALARASDPMRLVSAPEQAEAMRKITQRAVEMASTDIWIDEAPDVSVHRIRAQAASLKASRGPLGLVVVDYLQLVRPGSAETRTLELAEITRGLKLLAREVGCPVLAMSQLSRRVDAARGEDRLPRLSDLRESGSIEQDADVVILLHRPEARRPLAVGGHRPEDVAEPEDVMLNVAKNRFGPTGRIDALWYPAWALITAAIARRTDGRELLEARSQTGSAWLPYRD